MANCWRLPVAEIPEEAVAAVKAHVFHAITRWKMAASDDAVVQVMARNQLIADILHFAAPHILADFSKRTAGMAEALNNAAAIIEDRDRQLAAARAEERERLFVAIRRKIPLSQPWRGEALDLIYEVWRETDG